MTANYSRGAGEPSEPALVGDGWGLWWSRLAGLLDDVKMRRGLVFGSILVVALAAFEIFNFSTTEFALTDLLGDLRFAGLRWATILSIAFCGIDFAGLARLFTPERGEGTPIETWYLLGAWFLGATMNAMMTWWAVSLAMVNHSFGNEVISREQLLAYAPVFVAALVWLTRILIIGTFSIAGERLFSQAEMALMGAREAAARSRAARPRLASPAAQDARVIGGYEDDVDAGSGDRGEWKARDGRAEPRPRAVHPVPAVPPARAYRPATKPAPKPSAYRPAQALRHSDPTVRASDKTHDP